MKPDSPSKPPMGWNSFDCFGATVTEDEVLANAEFLATHLKSFGWNHVVVDYCWAHPSPPACTNPNQLHENQPYLAMDGDFRLLPAPERFPSAAQGAGFRPLADKIHRMGLKFGIHIMRGFPRQGIYPGYPAENLRHRPLEMADPESSCPWLNHMWGVRTDTEAGQNYYDSLLQLYASWGVDFLKTDDICYPYRTREIEAIDRARRRCGRPMTLSLSPGPCAVEHAAHVSAHAEMWRICADFWDDWGKLRQAFEYCRVWAPFRRPGAWPDADMLPLGRLSKRGPVGPEHESYFTPEEQKTLMTLWCIFRSPLFMGGNLPEITPATLDLLKNPEVLSVHGEAEGGFPLRQDNDEAIWTSQGTEGTMHVALFNFRETSATVGESWDQLAPGHKATGLRDLWNRQEARPSLVGISAQLPPHGAALFSIQLEPITKSHSQPAHRGVVNGVALEAIEV